MQIVQGSESNHSGQFLEKAIEDEFRRRGVEVFDAIEKVNNFDWVSECFLLRNAPYTSIYGCQSRSEFLYRDCRLGSDIRIECRWQQVAGSVDEKLPYLYSNAVIAMPEREVWLVVEGGGARPEAIDWLKRECSRVTAKKILVLNIPETRQQIKQLRTA